jgi:hypothetical protein
VFYFFWALTFIDINKIKTCHNNHVKQSHTYNKFLTLFKNIIYQKSNVSNHSHTRILQELVYKYLELGDVPVNLDILKFYN